MIRVLVADDQTLVRQGVKALLEFDPDVRVVGEADGGEAALDLAARLAPDVALLDVRMPGLGGLGVLAAWRDTGGPPAILLTTFHDDAAVREGLRLGARGYLLKDVAYEDLLDAVKQVARGGTLVRPAVTARALRGLEGLRAEGAPAAEAPALTERELDVLRLLSGGYSNREIAAALSLADGTVKNHVSNVLYKLGVRDRTRAVLSAAELGLL